MPVTKENKKEAVSKVNSSEFSYFVTLVATFENLCGLMNYY